MAATHDGRRPARVVLRLDYDDSRGRRRAQTFRTRQILPDKLQQSATAAARRAIGVDSKARLRGARSKCDRIGNRRCRARLDGMESVAGTGNTRRARADLRGVQSRPGSDAYAVENAG